MNQNEIKLQKIMAVVFNININSIDLNSSNSNTKNWDSLKHLSLVIAIEEEFSIHFTNEDISLLTDFKKITKLINEKLIS